MGVRDVDVLVRDHLPLVDRAVREMRLALPAWVDPADLASAGRLALTRAAQDFDEDRGVRFAAYAVHRVRGALVDELRHFDWAARSLRTRARTRDMAEEMLTGALGRRPTVAELAVHLDTTPADLHVLDHDLHRAVVLSTHALPDSTADVPTALPKPEEELLERERRAYLRDAVATLPPRLQRVARGLFYDDETVADVARDLSVTESRVCHMRAEALSLLAGALARVLDGWITEQRVDGVAARRREAYYASVAAASGYKARLAAPTSGEISRTA